jgi:hypothetical protein
MTDQGDGGTRSSEQPQPPAHGTPPPYGTPPAYGGPPAYGSAPSAPEYGTAEFGTMPPTAPYPGRSAYLEPSQSVLALVLGIIGLFVFWPVAPFAWVIGRNEVRAVDAGRRDPAGRGPAMAGMIMGIIGTVILVLAVLLAVLAVVLLVATASSAINS